ncbi:MAG: hypothetical protein ACHQUB_03665 [Candidatus Saccharimonadia bacterium]
MRILRVIILIYAGLYIIGAILLILRTHSSGNKLIAAYLLINGMIITAGILFERERYSPKISSNEADWVITNEKFKDDSSGKLMGVRYNAKTGERDYVEIETGEKKK